MDRLRQTVIALPIQARLTLWYMVLFALVLFVFAAGSYYAMQASILEEFDRDLKLRITGIKSFLDRESNAPINKLQHELQEHGQLRPGGELLQISDGAGGFLFASESMRHLRIHVPSKVRLIARTEITTVYARGIPVRLAEAIYAANSRRLVIQLGQSLEESSELVQHFGWTLLGSIPLVLVLAGVSGYWMAGRALRPVRRIIEDAQAITVLDISKRIAVPTAHDELRELSTTLNRMMDRLETSFRKITQFTADASHELRTPISLIRTTAELAMGDGSPQFASEALQSILEEAERTTDLLENLLMLARSDSNVKLQMEIVDLSEIFKEAVTQTELLAKKKNIHLTHLNCASALLVMGKADLLRRLILILTDNAVKYTEPNGQISLALSKGEAHIAVIEVCDTGIGISDEDLPHIFERFYRADKARQRSGGAGLGLSIADQIARTYRAQIAVRTQKDAGTTFTIIIPTMQEGEPSSIISKSPLFIVKP